MNVYVVAWEYGTSTNAPDGGGFDWYYDKLTADKMFIKEQENEKDPKLNNWKAYEFTVTVSENLTEEQITSYIDSIFVDRVDSIEKNK